MRSLINPTWIQIREEVNLQLLSPYFVENVIFYGKVIDDWGEARMPKGAKKAGARNGRNMAQQTGKAGEFSARRVNIFIDRKWAAR